MILFVVIPKCVVVSIKFASSIQFSVPQVEYTLGGSSKKGSNSIQFNSILLFYLDITYNTLILIYNVVQTMDDETNNTPCTTKHTGHTWQEPWTSVKTWCDEFFFYIINNFISWKVYVGITFGHIRIQSC